MTNPPRLDAVQILQRVAANDQVGNGVRLHCLRAADLLSPNAPVPRVRAQAGDPSVAIHAALAILAALPVDEFDENVRLAARHARRALLAIASDGDDG
jgi:hypothetical protein